MKIQLGKLEFEAKEFPLRLYNKNGNLKYFRNSNGYESWREYDDKGNEIYFRDSNGYEVEYDKDGNQTYFRNSNGEKIGTPRSKSLEGKIVEIEGKKYKLKEVK